MLELHFAAYRSRAGHHLAKAVRRREANSRNLCAEAELHPDMNTMLGCNQRTHEQVYRREYQAVISRL